MIVCDKCWGTKIQNGINNISRECGNCQGKGFKIPLEKVITTVSIVQHIDNKDNIENDGKMINETLIEYEKKDKIVKRKRRTRVEIRDDYLRDKAKNEKDNI
jgi:hypothetical protein